MRDVPLGRPLPLATQMFQFAKFEKSKERRLAMELGYGLQVRDPLITDYTWPGVGLQMSRVGLYMGR